MSSSLNDPDPFDSVQRRLQLKVLSLEVKSLRSKVVSAQQNLMTLTPLIRNLMTLTPLIVTPLIVDFYQKPWSVPYY